MTSLARSGSRNLKFLHLPPADSATRCSSAAPTDNFEASDPEWRQAARSGRRRIYDSRDCGVDQPSDPAPQECPADGNPIAFSNTRQDGVRRKRAVAA
jgi:hypothetical protein